MAGAINLPGMSVAPGSLGINANSLCVAPPRERVSRAAAPEPSPTAIGRAVAFFASERARSITGQTLNFCGALAMS